MYKKGEYTEAKLRYITHALFENRNGQIVDVETTKATGTAEIEAAQKLIKCRIPKGGSIGADKAYDQSAFVNALIAGGIRAHVARKKSGSAVDGRTARGKSYAQSLKHRKIVEEAFGWIKTVGGLRKTRQIGLAKVAGQSLFRFATYNLTRLINLLVFTPKPSWAAPT